jgi:predicted dehydrogenase
MLTSTSMTGGTFMNRRRFLHLAGAGLACAASGDAFDFQGQKPRRVGLIGSGWYGKCDLLRLIQVAPVEVVSLCDVDKSLLAQAADLVASRQPSGRKPRTHSDYREMLKERDLDICLVATPDHWHALPMIEAVRAGADVYVQKPISVDVVEGRAMVAAARKYKRVVQVGMQRRSTPHLVEARDSIIRAGRLGKIALVETHCYFARTAVTAPDIDPPDNLDYEMWTGPAPMRPFNRLVHPGGWRQFMEYGNGTIGDMGVHMLDMVRWMLDLGWPRSISSSGGLLVNRAGKANIPDTQIATFDYGDLKLVWQHRNWGQSPDPKYPWGATIYGEKGTLKAGVFSFDFTPMDKSEPVHRDVAYELDRYPEDKTEERLERHVAPAIRRHMLDFLAAIDARKNPVSDIEEGYISASCCILANLALKTGRTLDWDPAGHRVKNDDEANLLLRRPYRRPWIHPEAESV